MPSIGWRQGVFLGRLYGVSVLQLASCGVAKSVLRLALCGVTEMWNPCVMRSAKSMLRLGLCVVGKLRNPCIVAHFFAALLRGSSRLCYAALCGFLAQFFAALCGSAILSTVRPFLPLKPVAKAWSFELLVGLYLHCEGIVMDHILLIGVLSDWIFRS